MTISYTEKKAGKNEKQAQEKTDLLTAALSTLVTS